MVLWLTFWGAGMIVAVFVMGGAALSGEVPAAVFLVVWLSAAGFGLYNGARQLKALMTGESVKPRPPVSQPWHDGMSERPAMPPLDGGGSETEARRDQPPPPPPAAFREAGQP